MAPRLELQAKLEELLGSDEVYFQPPIDIEMKYPAIVYHRAELVTEHANDRPYRMYKRYMVTIIDRNPDSSYPEEIVMWPMTRHERHFKADNLNHDVFILYF